MKDYTATITIRVPITAKNDEQAQERADEISEDLPFAKVSKKPWFGDIEIEADAEEA